MSAFNCKALDSTYDLLVVFTETVRKRIGKITKLLALLPKDSRQRLNVPKVTLQYRNDHKQNLAFEMRTKLLVMVLKTQSKIVK